MPIDRLKNYLASNKVKYVTINHSPAFTASEIAELSHISGKEMVKTVIFHAGSDMCMAVVPSNFWVSCENLKKVTGAPFVELAQEHEFTSMFPGCAPGAMPPFGHLYDMDVFMDEKLLEDEMIAFSAGSHSQILQMALNDYVELANPIIVSLSTTHKHNAA